MQQEIHYHVMCHRTTISSDKEPRQKIIEACDSHRIVFPYLIYNMVNRSLGSIGVDKSLYDLLIDSDESHRDFETGDPLKDRRNAIRYAESLNDVMAQSEGYISSIELNEMLHNGLEATLNQDRFAKQISIYHTTVWFIYSGEEYRIKSDMPNISDIENMELEARLYKKHGYDFYEEDRFGNVTGSVLCPAIYIHKLGREAICLPDAKPYIEEIKELL